MPKICKWISNFIPFFTGRMLRFLCWNSISININIGGAWGQALDSTISVGVTFHGTRDLDIYYPRQLVPRTSRTQDNSSPRQLMPKTTRTQDNPYPRQTVPMWFNMIWNNVRWDDIWYDVIWYDMISSHITMRYHISNHIISCHIILYHIWMSFLCWFRNQVI